MKTLGTPQPDSDVVNKQPRVLLIGYGWVGQYMGKYFTEADYVKSDKEIRRVKDNDDYWRQDSIIDYKIPRFDYYDLAIISVPTPMDPETGQCDVSLVEEVVEKYRKIVGIFLVKSTVEIGTCRRLEEEYDVPVCMSPEYVGETLGHPLVEPRRDAFQIIGGNEVARETVAGYFMKVLSANAPILLCSHEEAEIIKYSENDWIMRRVDYWQDVYRRCNAFGASFPTVREGLVLDPRMDRTHSNVYSDNMGWSGKCLPKDMNALVYSMRKIGRSEQTVEFLISKNVKVRENYENNNKLIPEKPAWR